MMINGHLEKFTSLHRGETSIIWNQKVTGTPLANLSSNSSFHQFGDGTSESVFGKLTPWII
jgi:hypothetical protein